MATRLRALGHDIEINFSTGDAPADLYVDHPPWGGPSLKIELERFVATSLAIVIRKSADPNSRDWLPGWRWRLADRSQRFRYGATRRFDHLTERLKAAVKARVTATTDVPPSTNDAG
jgi:hypothetical protein